MSANDRERLIYPLRRALEHAATIPGLLPVRYTAVMYPLHAVEIDGTFRSEKEYDVLDRFVERAVVAGLTTADRVAAFLAVDDGLVRKVVDFLVEIDHLAVDQGQLRLMELGKNSLDDGVRYEWKRQHQIVYFDGRRQRPLPRTYVQKGSVVDAEQRDAVRFPEGVRRFFLDPEPWNPQALHDLANRTDRDQFNLPPEARQVGQVRGLRDAYLPMYVFEVRGRTDPLMAYTAAAVEPDEFFGQLLNEQPGLVRSFLQPGRDPEQLWKEWLTKEGFADRRPRLLPSGIWRVTLPTSAFGEGRRFSLHVLGSFYAREGVFLQLWCEDERTRRTAAAARANALVGDSDGQAELVLRIADQLEIDPG